MILILAGDSQEKNSSLYRIIHKMKNGATCYGVNGYKELKRAERKQHKGVMVIGTLSVLHGKQYHSVHNYIDGSNIIS